MTRWLFVAMVLAAGASGCGRSNQAPAASCTQVTDHVYAVTRKAYPGHGEMAMGNHKTDVAKCEATMDGAQRACLLAATDVAGLVACRRKHDKEPAKP